MTPRPVTIDAIIEDLHNRYLMLGRYLDNAAASEDMADLLLVFKIQAETASRLGRLLREQRVLSGKAADGLADAISATLDELINILDLPEGAL